MTYNAVIGTQDKFPYEETAISGHHSPIVKLMALGAVASLIEFGTILSYNAAGNIVPYQKITDETIGTGDGGTLDFEATLANTPIQPRSVKVVADTVELVDDGFGNLVGSDGSGTINYTTGAISISFNVAPGNGVDINVNYATKIAGVALETVDPSKEDVINVILHGTVWKDRLKIASGTLDANDYKLLEQCNIYVMP